MTSSDTWTGRTLGPYRIVAPLAAGGMAQVYRGVHDQLNRHVAVKVLRRDLALGAEFPDRFRREAQAVAGLRHPHIVQIFDFDSTGPQPYLVMELLEGGSLRALINDAATRADRLPLGEAIRVMVDTLDGLAYAHAAGIVHRDLKPGNILFSRDGRAVLTDFGIAVVPGDAAHTATGALMGTLAYMAPEQGLKGQAGVASDVYAMGIILYELATGRVPFEGDTPLSTLLKHVNEPLPDPCDLNPTLPQPIVAVIERALSKQPEGRFATASDMRVTLIAAAEASGIPLPERVAVTPETIAPVVSGAGRRAFEGSIRSEAATETPLTRPAAAEPSRYGAAVFVSLAVLFLVNFVAIGVGGMQGRAMEVIAAGWPFELLWVALLLALLGLASRRTAFLVPIGLTLTFGSLIAYYAATDRWDDWWWWLFAIAVSPTLILLAYAVARRRPPHSRDGLNAFLVLLTVSAIALHLWVVFS
jgi:serine/threonine-protein kinase